MEVPCCSLCDAKEIDLVGPTLHGDNPRVAGVPIQLGDAGLQLLRCRNCGLIFKYPPIPQDLLNQCYQAASDDHWELDPDPHVRQFDRIKTVLDQSVRGRRILDVGCFNGAFLSFLGEQWIPFGVEPSIGASRLAESRGIKVLGRDIELLDPAAHQFDAIVNLDVAEHLLRPMNLFRFAAKMLAPGGVILTVTGDTSSYVWRLHGHRTWYASLPEHVAFYSEETMGFIAHELNLEMTLFQRMPHKRRSKTHRALNVARHGVHAILGRSPKLLKTVGGKNLFPDLAPPAFSLADHCLVVFQGRE